MEAEKLPLGKEELIEVLRTLEREKVEKKEEEKAAEVKLHAQSVFIAVVIVAGIFLASYLVVDHYVDKGAESLNSAIDYLEEAPLKAGREYDRDCVGKEEDVYCAFLGGFSGRLKN